MKISKEDWAKCIGKKIVEITNDSCNVVEIVLDDDTHIVLEPELVSATAGLYGIGGIIAAGGRCPNCLDNSNKYPDGECQHGFLYY